MIHNWECTELGKELNTSADGARKRVERAVNSLIRNLGGWRTYTDIDNIEIEEANEPRES